MRRYQPNPLYSAKELPLSTIMSEINNIVVDIGRKVVVQWITK